MPVRLLKTYPVTILVSLVALAAWASPWFAEWLQLDYSLVAGGQWWRIQKSTSSSGHRLKNGNRTRVSESSSN